MGVADRRNTQTPVLRKGMFMGADRTACGQRCQLGSEADDIARTRFNHTSIGALSFLKTKTTSSSPSVRSAIVFAPDHRICRNPSSLDFEEFYTAMAVLGLDGHSRKGARMFAICRAISLSRGTQSSFPHIIIRTM